MAWWYQVMKSNHWRRDCGVVKASGCGWKFSAIVGIAVLFVGGLTQLTVISGSFSRAVALGVTPFALLEVSGHLFEAEDAEVIASVTRLRPFFPRFLESPPAPGE